MSSADPVLIPVFVSSDGTNEYADGCIRDGSANVAMLLVLSDPGDSGV